MKDSFPVQLAEYSVRARISQEPAFAWWVSFLLKKRNRVISKVKLKYWVRTYKVGIRVPKSVAEAKRLDEAKGDALWWDAICREMKNVRIALEDSGCSDLLFRGFKGFCADRVNDRSAQ